MKKLIGLVALAIATIANANAAAPDSTRQKMTKEQQMEFRAKHMANGLMLNDAARSKFMEVYTQYQKEMRELAPQGKMKKPAEMTDAEIKQAYKDNMQKSRKRLDLREKYYDKYCTFLTQKQILRLNQLEKTSMKHGGRFGKGFGHHRPAMKNTRYISKKGQAAPNFKLHRLPYRKARK